jgi:hypothetical protein
MRLTRVELLFIALGAALGAMAGYAARTGLIPPSVGLPPFFWLLLGLGLAEVAGGLATGSAPGRLVTMPARLLAFAIGVGVLLLVNGSLA